MGGSSKKIIYRAGYNAQKIFWAALDVVLPPECPGCEKLGQRLCRDCFMHIEHMPDNGCEICGDYTQEQHKICKSCQQSRPAFERMRSWSVFKPPIRDVLHSLKYKRDLGMGDTLSESFALFIQAQEWMFDCIIPVPLSKERLRHRGYNQVDVVAWPVSCYLGIEYLPNAMERVRHTKSQVGLSAEERHGNVRGAFRADSKISGRRALVMDDVITTGATVNEASQALLDAGAETVYVVSIARALAKHGWDRDFGSVSSMPLQA